MRVPRFFACGADLSALKRFAESEVEAGSQLELAEDDLIKQLRSVLRLGQGHKIILLDGLGGTYEFEIERVEKQRVYCRLLKKLAGDESKSLSIIVGLALIKADRFEWCIEKLTELGVSEIAPVSTRHCVIKLNRSEDAKGDNKNNAKLSRWNSIAREAAEQCERSTIPPVVKSQSLDRFLERPSNGGTADLRFICCERS
ncbi:MAG: 16S rRNA (uracil(1498)-N(3))-methyltransferase, partial [Candidatus Obscuribacterales bacterium]|nr:16S rRNA (uracil(1498)-N(3))-methyltransferase [Candidatus Obscuribacterales bacterium]